MPDKEKMRNVTPKRGRPAKEKVVIPKTTADIKMPPVAKPKKPKQDLMIVNPENLLTLAIKKGADIETIERLLAMRKELKAEWAREQYFKALAAFQLDCPVVFKRKPVKNKEGKLLYKYAPLEDIVKTVKPFLQKHGFSYTIKGDQTDKEIKAECHIYHIDGHSEISTFTVPIDPGTNAMSAIQRRGSSNTYAKKYAFCNGFGIMTADEDTDGNDKGAATEKTELKKKDPPKAKSNDIDECMKSIETALNADEFSKKLPAQTEALWAKAEQLKKDKNLNALMAFAKSVIRQQKAFANK